MNKTDSQDAAQTLETNAVHKTFPLLRYFTVISLSSITLASILLGTWVRNIAVDNLTFDEERNNIALTRVLSNIVWPRYKDFIKSAQKYTPEQLRAHPKIQELNTFINNQVEGLNIVKI